SSLRKIALESGEVKRSLPLPGRYFGEGITIIGERVIQLTWQAGIGFVSRLDGFRKIAEFHYPGEGWGITHDGKRLIMSDGSATLRFLDPRTFKENGRVTVRDRGVPVPRLNELEHIRGEIYANVWKTDRIARISPKDGSVRGWIDLRGLLSPRDRLPSTDVLNGIAYDAKGKRLFVTGKDWPKLFEIELVEKRPERGPARPGVPGGKEQ
ncbi:MAG: glutaminyl-peptide cyclotransferase, partial [Planctomycetota bacterium]